MNFFGNKFGKSKVKGAKPLFLTEPYQSSTLVNGSFKKISVLPKYVDENEWLASNTQDFFNFIGIFYGTIVEYCDQQTCPAMNAGPNHEYHWTDSQKRSLKIHAVQYIDFVFSWVQNMLADENIFPTRSGYAFPKDFGMTVRMIFKQLFRVLAHIYHSHYDIILNLSEESHLNTLFAHFVCFAKVFDLLEKKEFIPMQELIESLEAAGRI